MTCRDRNPHAPAPHDDLTQHSALLSAILETSGLLVIVLDRQARIVLFNHACEQLTGYRRDAVEGRHIWDVLLRAEDVPPVREVFDALSAGHFPNEHDNPWIARDGTECWVHWTNTALTDETGTVSHVIGTGIDVTDRRRAADELEAAHRFTQAVLETAVDAIITIDSDGIIQSFNAAAETMFGYQAEEAVGRNVSMLMPEPYTHEHDDYLRRYLETGEHRIIGTGREVRGRRKDGTTFPMHLSVGAVRLLGRRFFTGIVRDITDYKRAEQEARTRLDELAHVSRLASINEMASGLAHEINQPLTAVISHAQASQRVLKRDTPDLTMVRESLEQIVHQGRRASDIVANLRQFVRKSPRSHGPVDLNELIEGVSELIEHELRAHTIELELDLDPSLAAVAADKVQIEQVVLNLARNAIQAMAEDTTDASRLTIITGPATDERGGVQVVISDTGPGLTPEALERIFEPFYTTKPDGLGQGLSICQRIVEAHHGRLWAERLDPRGMRFCFRLPLDSANG